MPITIFTGNAGAGKSTMLAEQHLKLLDRNYKWYKKSGIVRPLVTNLKLHPEIEAQTIKKGFLKYWKDPLELVLVKDSDVLIDEVARYFDASQWQNTPLTLKAWIQQHRKMGVEIYGNAQDFGQVDIAVRRLTSELYYLVKLISSRDPSPTKPPVKRIWGVSSVYSISPTDYKENQKENSRSFTKFFFITRRKCAVFDTRQVIEAGTYPPLTHIERHCEQPECKHVKVIHV